MYAVLVVFASMVPGLGLLGPSPDHENYRILYDWAAESSVAELALGNDPGYFLLSKAALAAGIGFEAFLFLLALLTCTLHAILLARLKTDRWVLVGLYGSYLFWLHDYTQVRFALGFALVLLGLTGSGRARALLCVLGALVHASVLLAVAAYLVLSGRRVLMLGACLVLLLLLATGLLDGIVSSLALRAATYQDILALGMFDELNRFSLMPMVQALCMLGSWNASRVAGRDARTLWWLAACGLAGFYGLAGVPVLAFRVYEMFIPFFLILMSRLWRRSVALQLLLPLYVLLGLRVSFLSADALFPLLQ